MNLKKERKYIFFSAVVNYVLIAVSGIAVGIIFYIKKYRLHHLTAIMLLVMVSVATILNVISLFVDIFCFSALQVKKKRYSSTLMLYPLYSTLIALITVMIIYISSCVFSFFSDYREAIHQMVVISLIYIGLLFAVAFFGSVVFDKIFKKVGRLKINIDDEINQLNNLNLSNSNVIEIYKKVMRIAALKDIIKIFYDELCDSKKTHKPFEDNIVLIFKKIGLCSIAEKDSDDSDDYANYCFDENTMDNFQYIKSNKIYINQRTLPFIINRLYELEKMKGVINSKQFEEELLEIVLFTIDDISKIINKKILSSWEHNCIYQFIIEEDCKRTCVASLDKFTEIIHYEIEKLHLQMNKCCQANQSSEELIQKLQKSINDAADDINSFLTKSALPFKLKKNVRDQLVTDIEYSVHDCKKNSSQMLLPVLIPLVSQMSSFKSYEFANTESVNTESISR